MQRLGDLEGQMGRKTAALRLHEEAKRRILAERSRHPESLMLQGDVGVACDRIADLRLAAGDTLGALRESLEGLDAVTDLCRRDPREPFWRRNLAVAYAKTADLRAANHDRVDAARDYMRAQELTLECLRNQPDNTDLSRDLGVVYGMRASFLADGGEIDSALALYGRATAIAERLAALDLSDALQQADLAKGRFEVGKVLMRGHRYREAEDRFADAYRRYTSLAAKDTSNTELCAQAARSSRNAGDACLAMSQASGDRSLWRSRAAEWYARSATLYRTLTTSGALQGAELAAVDQVSKLLDSVR
jgi:tetratricopeptide (TPR) repeat protein